MPREQLTAKQKLAVAERFYATLRRLDEGTIIVLAEAWLGAYMDIGHKALGRILIGQEPTKALRLGDAETGS